jgi:hypothetical protein
MHHYYPEIVHYAPENTHTYYKNYKILRRKNDENF